MTKSKMCSRCGTYPPLDDPFHRGIGAISRTDNKTKICNDCGVEEAIDDFRGFKLASIEMWPVSDAKGYD